MRRYFMLMTEAVHLVLQAARLARGGELFVLEMGEQISVLEMARNLIRLSGLVPDKDIALTYLGCRPGEKLTEELVAGHETVESTTVQKVLCIRPDPARNFAQLSGLVARLEESAAEGHVSKVLALLCAILPTYCPAGTSFIQERGGETDGLLSEDPAQSPAGIETGAGLAPTAPLRRK